MTKRSIMRLLVLLPMVLAGCTQPQDDVVTNQEVDTHKLLMLTNEELNSIGLTDAVAVVQSIPVKITLSGTIQANPNLTTPVASLVPGRIESVAVQHGDTVRNGQVLCRVRSDEVAQIENDYLSKLVELDAEHKELQVDLALRQKIYDRRHVLLDEKIAARAEFELAETERDEASLKLSAVDDKREALYRSTRERISLFGLPESELIRLNKTKSIQAMFNIRSPRSGIITNREADPGEMIESGEMLFQVADLSRVWISAQVFERDIRFLKKELPVQVEFESFPGEHFGGIIDFVGSQIDRQTRTMVVRTTIANPGTRLKPEMFARITVKTGKATGLAVPRESVQEIGEVSVVYIPADKNHFMERRVRTGQVVGDMVEIADGLKPGERVVVKGSLQLLGQDVRRLSQ